MGFSEVRVQLALVAGLFAADSAYADLFGNITHSTAIEDAIQNLNNATNKAANEIANSATKGVSANIALKLEKQNEQAAAKLLIHELSNMSDDELLAYSVSINPCDLIECHGVSSDATRQFAGLVRTEKQTAIDLRVRENQAWAAMVSAGVAGLSLLISIASFVRAGRRVS